MGIQWPIKTLDREAVVREVTPEAVGLAGTLLMAITEFYPPVAQAEEGEEGTTVGITAAAAWESLERGYRVAEAM